MTDGLDVFLGRVQRARQSGPNRYACLCPAHDDRHESLSAGRSDDGTPLLYCHAGCETDDVLAAVEMSWRHLYGGDRGQRHGLTLAELAFAKHLPESFLRGLGCREFRGAVQIPYADESGTMIAIRTRTAMRGNRFRWRNGDRTQLYGLERLAKIREAGWVLLVEGESDCWTAWHAGLPALGIPGKSTWKAAWASLLLGLEVVLWQEPDAADLVTAIAADIARLRVIVAPPGTKDISEAHIRGEDAAVMVADLRSSARPAADLIGEWRDAARADSFAAARPVLDHPDPMGLVMREIVAQGYGGDVRIPMLGYLAMTSRVLRPRQGSMPAHTLFKGPSSGGKNAALRAGLRLLPAEAYHVIDAGSPRVLIYDTEPLIHRVVVFSEADSLPAGEDNPAASAIRNLLQDGHLHYKVTERDAKTGSFAVRTIDKPGPSVLITTATKSLGSQLMTRLFTIEVPDEPTQLRAALAAQAALELDDAPPANAALLAFQGYLHSLAPVDVVVPFARELAGAIGRRPMGPRVLRDFPRLLSLVKATALLRIKCRMRDERGRLVATIDDYVTVHGLVADTYEASAGASRRVRDVVVSVKLISDAKGLEGTASVSEVAERLQLAIATTWRRIGDAIKGGWVVNEETRRGQTAKLRVGEPLPASSLLPTPDEIRGLVAGTVLAPVSAPSPDDVFTFSPETGGSPSPTSDPDLSAAEVDPPVNAENVKTEHERAVAVDAPDLDGWIDVIEAARNEPEPPFALWDQP